MIYPEKFELEIGFDKIRNDIRRRCLGEAAKNKIDNLSFCNDFDKIKTDLNRVEEFKNIIITGEDFPCDYFFDLSGPLSKIAVENTFLTLRELFDMRRTTGTIKSITEFFSRSNQDKYFYLSNLVSEINIPKDFFKIIDNVLNPEGEIKDSASPELREIRQKIYSKKSSISAVISRIMRNAKSNGIADGDAEVTIRDGKMLIPVQSSGKRKISGIVYDESSTGKTSFIEPLESIELNNAVRELEFAERREIVKILTSVTDQIRPYIYELSKSFEISSEIDFVRAKALFAVDTNCCLPKLTRKSTSDIRTAKNPVLLLNFKNENRKVVPLSYEISEKNRIIMISGPNAGGKSVCLKTVGIIQYMHQCGIPVPASNNSVIGIFDKIFIDIGDEQSMENDLSTYSSHLKNMKFFIDNADEHTLILIDEFGSGTEPIHGGAIAEAVLKRLNEKQVRGVITTHYTNLKNYAEIADGIINGAMLYNKTDLKPLFEMEIGHPGNSFAFEIAQNIGLDKNLLIDAEEIAGREHIDYERKIQEISETERKLKLRLENVTGRENNLIKLQERLSEETEKTLNERKSVINQAKAAAKEILDNANGKIEKTIFEIRKAEADKGKTKEIRKELNEFKEKLDNEISDQEQKIDETIERIRRKQEEKAERKRQRRIEKEKENALKDSIPKERELKAGDAVTLDNSDAVMTILNIKDQTAEVQMGNMSTFVALKRLNRIKKEAADVKISKPVVSVNIEARKGDFLFGLDVRGFRGDEALQRVSKYLDQALAAGSHEIRILHGTGNGILRNLIRDYLQTQLIVKSYRDERIESGGAGITVAELDY